MSQKTVLDNKSLESIDIGDGIAYYKENGTYEGSLPVNADTLNNKNYTQLVNDVALKVPTPDLSEYIKKAQVLSALMPNYKSGTSLSSGAVISAPGWVIYYLKFGTGNVWQGQFYINGVSVGSFGFLSYDDWTGQYIRGIAPVDKGDTVTFSAASAIYYPCKGF